MLACTGRRDKRQKREIFGTILCKNVSSKEIIFPHRGPYLHDFRRKKKQKWDGKQPSLLRRLCAELHRGCSVRPVSQMPALSIRVWGCAPRPTYTLSYESTYCCRHRLDFWKTAPKIYRVRLDGLPDSHLIAPPICRNGGRAVERDPVSS